MLLAASARQLNAVAAQALIDGLTGIGNRSLFERRLLAERSLARRLERPLSCIMIDIDYFKAINDTYGHNFGDEVLSEFAQLFLQSCRREDTACRYGGEEFVLLLPNTPAEGARVVAERLRNLIASHEFLHDGKVVHVTCSCGVSTLASDDSTIVKDADEAMYKAKQGGRNQVVLAPTS